MAKQMKKLNIKALNPGDIGLSGAMGHPAAQLVAKVVKLQVELIAIGAQFMRDTILALCANVSSESLKLAIQIV